MVEHFCHWFCVIWMCAYVHRNFCVYTTYSPMNSTIVKRAQNSMAPITIHPTCCCIYMLACGGSITKVETPRIGSTVASHAALNLQEWRKPSSHPLVLVAVFPWCHTSCSRAAPQPPLLSASYGILHILAHYRVGKVLYQARSNLSWACEIVRKEEKGWYIFTSQTVVYQNYI